MFQVYQHEPFWNKELVNFPQVSFSWLPGNQRGEVLILKFTSLQSAGTPRSMPSVFSTWSTQPLTTTLMRSSMIVRWPLLFNLSRRISGCCDCALLMAILFQIILALRICISNKLLYKWDFGDNSKQGGIKCANLWAGFKGHWSETWAAKPDWYSDPGQVGQYRHTDSSSGQRIIQVDRSFKSTAIIWH